jgi:hypothetical protein
VVAYQPPDDVMLAVGASFKADPLLIAAERVSKQAKKDVEALSAFGVTAEDLDKFEQHIREVKRTMADPRAQKNDTPLQMAELAEVMARARGWLRSLRMIAAINLTLDAPAIERISSLAPDVVEGYARDLLADLKRKINAAADLRPRLEEVGLTDAFMTRGRKLATQLDTAIGKADIDGDSLHLTVRRLYMRKAQLYLSLKRISRAGQVANLMEGDRGRVYRLDEIEPEVIEDPRPAKTAKKSHLSVQGTPPITRRPGRP